MEYSDFNLVANPSGQGYIQDGVVQKYYDESLTLPIIHGTIIPTNMAFTASGRVSADFVGSLKADVEYGVALQNDVTNGDVETSVISDNNNSKFQLLSDGTWIKSNIYNAGYQNFIFDNTHTYFFYVKLASDTVAEVSDIIWLYYSDSSNESFSTGSTPLKEFGITIQPSKSLSGNLAINEKLVGLIKRENQMLINMTALGIASFSEAEMLTLVQKGYFDDYKIFTKVHENDPLSTRQATLKYEVVTASESLTTNPQYTYVDPENPIAVVQEVTASGIQEGNKLFVKPSWAEEALYSEALTGTCLSRVEKYMDFN